MKDYTFKLEDKQTFILHYEIKDNEIILHLADGNTYAIPYTEENERRVLNKMEMQVVHTRIFKEDRRERNEGCSKRIIIYLIVMAINVVFLLNGGGIFSALALGCFALAEICAVLTCIKSSAELNDAYKNTEFLEKKEELNEALKTNKNMLNNVKKKTKDYVSTIINNNEELDINKIDEIPYDQLIIMLGNLKNAKTFNFDFSVPEEEKPAVLTKKM